MSKPLETGSFPTLLAWSSSLPAPGAGRWFLGTVSRAEVRQVQALAMAAWDSQAKGTTRAKVPMLALQVRPALSQVQWVGGQDAMFLSW